mgnify:CR=1 FL=1|tara:strand:+ start:4392 stop:4868 length:477 start_codon:yes stop_codon:yes gene_type:complete
MNLIYQNIESLNIPLDTKVTLRYEQTADCFLMNEDEVETAMSETDVISSFAGLVATPGLNLSMSYHGDILEALRAEGLLDDYERDNTFEEYLTEVFSENHYDLEMVDSTIEKYDYKRGACTLSVQAHTTVENLLNIRPILFGWSAQIESEQAIITLEG